MSATDETDAARVFTCQDVLEALDARDRDEQPVMTASQLAESDSLDTSHVTALRRLRELEDDGRVSVAEVAGTRVWWLASERMRPLDGSVPENTRREKIREVAYQLEQIAEELKEVPE